MSYFVIGDVHGCYTHLQKVLKDWNPDKEELIFTGDLIDRGPDSLSVLKEVFDLKRKYGARVIQGNHEELFLSYLSNPDSEKELYFSNGGDKTISSLLRESVNLQSDNNIINEKLFTNFSEEIEFISNMMPYYETEQYIFIHAGMDFNYINWHTQQDSNFRWIRNPFIYGKNDTGKKVVFGHTVTRHLNQDKSDDVWFSPCGTKIGIDGGAVFGGKLHGLKIHGEDIAIFSHG